MRTSILATLAAAATGGVLVATGCGSGGGEDFGLPAGKASRQQVLDGRYLVISSGCGDCHNNGPANPADPNWLAGANGSPQSTFEIGPFKTYPANITPDTTYGIGKFTDRQIFNALRYGLDPEDTPSVVITSSTPGTGNFPTDPHYLAPPMVWPALRHKNDVDLWAMVAYLKHGVKANARVVPDSEGPPDHWASAYPVDATGPFPAANFPTASETFAP